MPHSMTIGLLLRIELLEQRLEALREPLLEHVRVELAKKMAEILAV